ncbi:unnamed protein product [Calypogeia fissa]
MASPIVPRRSARLATRTTTASVIYNKPPSPEREVVTKRRRKNPEQVVRKVTSILAKAKVISPKRGKISAYFSKITSEHKVVSGGKKTKKKKKGKESKVAVKATCDAGDKCSESKSEILATQDVSSSPPVKSGKETQVPAKNARIVKKGPSREMEAELWERGFQHVAGVDEAGRGPLAGPVVAAACIIPSHIVIDGINDSKKLTEERREELYSKLTTTPGISYAVHVIDAQTIDEVNILQATMQAMAACVEKLNAVENGLPLPDFILIDGNRVPSDIPETKSRSVVKGDAICHVIAAASILAKVTRDRLMISYHEKWPMYGFKAHKGYGTAAHIAAIRKHGGCDIHRQSFAPLKEKLLSTSGA